MWNLVEELDGFEPTIRVLQTRALPLGYSSLNPADRPILVHEYSAVDDADKGADTADNHDELDERLRIHAHRRIG